MKSCHFDKATYEMSQDGRTRESMAMFVSLPLYNCPWQDEISEMNHVLSVLLSRL